MLRESIDHRTFKDRNSQINTEEHYIKNVGQKLSEWKKKCKAAALFNAMLQPIFVETPGFKYAEALIKLIMEKLTLFQMTNAGWCHQGSTKLLGTTSHKQRNKYTAALL